MAWLLPHQVDPQDIESGLPQQFPERTRPYRIILGERMLTPEQANLVCHVFNTQPGPRLVDMKFVLRNEGLIQFVCDIATWDRMFGKNEDDEFGTAREFFANGIRCMCMMARYR
jgi:hypothetical protein